MTDPREPGQPPYSAPTPPPPGYQPNYGAPAEGQPNYGAPADESGFEVLPQQPKRGSHAKLLASVGAVLAGTTPSAASSSSWKMSGMPVMQSTRNGAVATTLAQRWIHRLARNQRDGRSPMRAPLELGAGHHPFRRRVIRRALAHQRS